MKCVELKYKMLRWCRCWWKSVAMSVVILGITITAIAQSPRLFWVSSDGIVHAVGVVSSATGIAISPSVTSFITTTFGCTTGCSVYTLPENSLFAPDGLTNPGHTPFNNGDANSGGILMSARNLIRWINPSGSANYNYIGMLNTSALNLGVSIGGFFGFRLNDTLMAMFQRNNTSGGLMLTFGPNNVATLATLGTVNNGSIQYCSDCLYASNPCTGSSTGAFAKAVAGVWRCD